MKKIVLLTMSLFAFCSIATAQMIGATNNQGTPRTNPTIKIRERTDGPAIRISGGFPVVASAAYNYRLSPYFELGGGIGIGYSGGTYSWETYYKPVNSYTYYPDGNGEDNHRTGDLCMPLYVESMLRLPLSKWSFFVNVKAGYNLFRKEDYTEHHTWETPQYEISDAKWDLMYTFNPFLFAAAIGVGYGNVELGLGVSTVYYLNCFVSYDLPL